MKKLGRSQEALLHRTLSMVAYTLGTIGPLTAYGIHKKTKIHRTLVLPRALYILESNRVIIKRRGETAFFPFEDDRPDVKSRYKNEYYLLNWSNPDAKMFYRTYKDHFLEIDPNAPVFDEDKKDDREDKIDELEMDMAKLIDELVENSHKLFGDDECYSDKYVNEPLDSLIHMQLRHGFRPTGLCSYISLWEQMQRNGLMKRLERIKALQKKEIVHCEKCNAEIRQFVDSDGLSPAPPPGGWKCYKCMRA